MKIKAILLVLFVISTGLSAYMINSNNIYNKQQSTKQTTIQQPYKKFYYIVTKIEGDNYYGKDVQGTEEGIYFISKNIKGDTNIRTGDYIVAYFDPMNTVDGLIKVEKGVKTEDGSIVPVLFYQ